MIKALIFDFGQVLVHFDPDYILSEDFPDKATRDRIAPIAFSRAYWDLLDDGTLSEEQAFERMEREIPEEYRAGVKNAITNWYYRLPEWEGMRELVCHFKERGYPVFVISNISRGFAERASEIPILALTDGAIFSALCHATKPSAEIFDMACRQFGYPKEECVFIDDSQKNIDGAKAFGLNAIRFDGNADELKKALCELLEQ